ncbi:kinase-like domain-containing protein [Kockovaella imperatae]|uniref:Kinase-like domain-containing protein n=1 Tax=Kockovaella imperatae TaxID=4999 RepID=A0A1Y1UT65_9TREE|nr:kinase-like domain-containing protein [Kockovaella imperatae]ORX40724.1 kinase-like domain-containing protein [Kockovaella imperatae]
MASSANVQLPRPEVTATPAPITEPSPLSAGRQSTKPTRRKTGPGELYERLACVGEGTYGKVYKARNAENGQFVALKRIRMEGEKDGFPVTAMREIKVLQALSHPNVLRLIEMMVSKGSVYMVLEYMDHDLTGLLAHPEIQMSPANIKSLNHQMLSGLAYLHQQGILHRDMKGSNILLSGRGELKLADFGLARTYSKHKRDDYTNRVITLWYRSPELLLGETVYGPEVDMWSAGCIMLELFTSKPVFQGTDEISQLEVIYYVLGTPSETIWPGLGDLPWYELVKPKQELGSRFEDIFSKWLSPAAMDLARGLLTFDPSRRLGAESALETAYFVSELPPMEMPTQWDPRVYLNTGR